MAIITARPKLASRDLIFGHGAGGFSGWSKQKRKLDSAISKPLPHWTVHDIRRTVATGMAEIGAQPHIIEAILNHQSGHRGGVAGIYNRASYEVEKRTALNRWAEHLLAIVEGRASNVVTLRA